MVNGQTFIDILEQNQKEQVENSVKKVDFFKANKQQELEKRIAKVYACVR